MPLPPQLPPDFRPRLRPGIVPAEGDSPDLVLLHDSRRISPTVLGLAPMAVAIIRLFDGSRTLQQLHQMLAASGIGVSPEVLGTLAAGLDEALFLDSPALHAYLNGPVRRPSCVGCYSPDADETREILRGLFTAPGGPGLPARPGSVPSPHGRLRAALLPHMDYARGGVTYGWGFKELVEQSDADVFVVVATSHYSPNRFTLTRMDFDTPLGVVVTDRAYVDRLADLYGDGVFHDPYAHLPEHSIELEVVLLQYLLETRRPFKIVPLLVGSFHDLMHDPAEAEDIARMVAALRRAEAESGRKVCYLISGDLAHIGPKFGDPEAVTPAQLAASREQDAVILDQLTAADPAGYFAHVAAEEDARRICGLPPTWLTLAAVRPRHGRVLHYQQFVHPAGHESVSFAAAAFYE